MLKRCRKMIGAVTVAVAVAVMIGAPTASAGGPYQYGGYSGPYYAWSAWLIGHYGQLAQNQAVVWGFPMCVTAIDEIGGGEAGSGICSSGTGSQEVVTHPYCGCQGRTAAVRNISSAPGWAVTGPGYVGWAQDWL
jgi:hypothetical protein